MIKGSIRQEIPTINIYVPSTAALKHIKANISRLKGKRSVVIHACNSRSLGGGRRIMSLRPVWTKIKLKQKQKRSGV
jgi:hypothetical protein